jgi:hypothetical protein
MNIVEDIKALRAELTSNKSLSIIIRVSSIKDKYSAIDDLCALALEYVVCGYEHKAARCYLYALAAYKSIKSKIFMQKLSLYNTSSDTDKVNVAGDFNHWNRDSIPMAFTNGSFSAEIPLEKGKTYQFRYILNGKNWFNDPKYRTIDDGKGTRNMLLKT